jgi:hypothetical protein
VTCVCAGSEQYVTAGAGECAFDVDCPSMCTCTETRIDCAHRQLDRVPTPLPRFVTHLSLASNQITTFDDVHVFERATNLQHLFVCARLLDNYCSRDLSGNAIQSLPTGLFANLKNLREL